MLVFFLDFVDCHNAGPALAAHSADGFSPLTEAKLGALINKANTATVTDFI